MGHEKYTGGGLPDSGVNISNIIGNPIGFGTAAYAAGTEQDQKTKMFPARPGDLKKDTGLLRIAIGLGFHHIDTGQAYGASELAVRRAILAFPHEQLTIATKVGIIPPDTGTSPYDYIIDAAQKSRERLGRVPNVLFLHNRWEDREQDMLVGVKGLVAAVKIGHARSVGLSNLRPDELGLAIDEVDKVGGTVSVYQAKVNLANPRPDAAETRKICRANGIVFEASAALNRGLTGSQDASDVVTEIAYKYDMTPAQVGIRAVYEWGAVPLVQTKNPMHMRENLAALSFEMEQPDVERLLAYLPK